MKIFAVLLGVLAVSCSGLSACAKPASEAVNEADKRAVGGAVNAPSKGVVGEVSIANDSGKAAPAQTLSFGQIFQPGAVRFDSPIELVVGDRALPAQLDAKALNPDGSVRHGLITVELPSIRGHERLAATIRNDRTATLPPVGAYVSPPALKVALQVREAGHQPQTLQFDLPTIARSQEQAKPDLWLSGPLGQQQRYVVDVTRTLQLAFDVFRPRSGQSRVDVIFRNDWNDVRTNDVVDYDVEITLDGETLYSARGVRQRPYTTWHRLISSDKAEPLRVTPKLADLVAAGAVPNYDSRFAVSESRKTLVDVAGSLPTGPLNPGSVMQYMPTSGGRMDIGPLPTWAVLDLLDGDELTRRVLLANADASGSIPWHIRERKTGSALTLDHYPRLWLDGRGEDHEPLAQAFAPDSDWTLDPAHEPSLTYLPYLITGLRYYQDELAQQAAYNLLAYDPGYRGGAAGLIIGDDGQSWEQIRALAWSLRTIANAAYILPHGDPMQAYFDAKLKGNLAQIVKLFVVERRLRAAGELEGWTPGVYRPDNAVAPWQQGYLAIVLGWTNDMGYPDAGRTLDWMSNFLTGLFTSKDRGFDPRFGASYVLIVRKDDDDNVPFSTWAEVAKANNLANRTPNGEEWENYGLLMRGAMASIYRAKPSDRTKAAYNYIDHQLGPAAQSGDPTFAIVPR